MREGRRPHIVGAVDGTASAEQGRRCRRGSERPRTPCRCACCRRRSGGSTRSSWRVYRPGASGWWERGNPATSPLLACGPPLVLVTVAYHRRRRRTLVLDDDTERSPGRTHW